MIPGPFLVSASPCLCESSTPDFTLDVISLKTVRLPAAQDRIFYHASFLGTGDRPPSRAGCFHLRLLSLSLDAIGGTLEYVVSRNGLDHPEAFAFGQFDIDRERGVIGIKKVRCPAAVITFSLTMLKDQSLVDTQSAAPLSISFTQSSVGTPPVVNCKAFAMPTENRSVPIYFLIFPHLLHLLSSGVPIQRKPTPTTHGIRISNGIRIATVPTNQADSVT